MEAARSNARAAFTYGHTNARKRCRVYDPTYGVRMKPLTRQPFGPRSADEVLALLSSMATAVLAVIIIAMLYFGRDIFVPVALAILLSFVLAPLV